MYKSHVVPRKYLPALVEDFTNSNETFDSRITFTRASSATYINSSGLLATAPSGVARAHAYAHHDIATLQCLGYLHEEQTTNNALWCRDLTNVAWTKVNGTAALTATGVDGTANSASTLTATSANMTVLQTVTSTSRARFLTAFIKRRTGTGNIQMTLDGGTTWTTVTITSSYRRYKIPSQTIANPQFGFRIVTSGDAIDVDYVQQEDRNFETSPILTTTAAAVRLADVALISDTNFSSFWNAEEGTLMAWFRRDADTNTDQGRVACADDGGSTVELSVRHYFATTPATQILVASVGVAGWNKSTNPAAGTLCKAVLAYKLNNSNSAFDGTAATIDTSCTIPTVNRLHLGNRAALNRNLNGCILRVVYYARRLSDIEMESLTI